MGKDDVNRDNTGYDLVNAEEICDTIDTIIKRHEADYTRLYVELDELFKNKDGDSQWQHTARWVSVGHFVSKFHIYFRLNSKKMLMLGRNDGESRMLEPFQ